VTAKLNPNDVDIVLLMTDAFDAGTLDAETRLVFDHDTAQSHFGASVLWLRKLAAIGGEESALEHWHVKRDGSVRGIVEIVEGAR
jgi:hypothetical protein